MQSACNQHLSTVGLPSLPDQHAISMQSACNQNAISIRVLVWLPSLPTSRRINGHQRPSEANLTFQMQALIIHLFIAHAADHVHTFLFERFTVDPACRLAQAAAVLAFLSLQQEQLPRRRGRRCGRRACSRTSSGARIRARGAEQAASHAVGCVDAPAVQEGGRCDRGAR